MTDDIYIVRETMNYNKCLSTFLSYFFVKKIPLSRRIEYLIGLG